MDDWGGGIYRGRKAPPNSFYDLVNGLINDESLPFKRGGSAYKTASDVDTLADALVGIADIVIGGTQKTLVWGLGQDAVPDTAFYTVDGSGTATQIAVLTDGFIRPLARGVGMPGQWFVPFGTSAGTYDKLLLYNAGVGTMTAPTGPATIDYLAVVGSPARIIITSGNRAYFTDRGADTTTMTASTYHELPQNAPIIGADAISDTLVLFTTSGVWTVANMALDPVDDFGNLQNTVSQVNKDVILWGDPGISGWAGALVVPAVDDVYLFTLDGQARPISENIRPLYRSYVKAGYTPGTAAVHRGHYFLPIVNSASSYALVDMLVCRLDRGFAWTRWSGHAASVAYAQRVGSSTRSPKLFGLSAAKVTDLTGCFDPTTANAAEADGTVHDFTLTTRDYPTGQQPGFVQRVRARYELTNNGAGSTPTVAVAFSSDADAGAFTTLTEKGEQGGAAGWATSDGSKYQWALVAKRRERIRFRFTQSGAAGSFVWRLFEMLTRPQGRQ